MLSLLADLTTQIRAAISGRFITTVETGPYHVSIHVKESNGGYIAYTISFNRFDDSEFGGNGFVITNLAGDVLHKGPDSFVQLVAAIHAMGIDSNYVTHEKAA